MKRLWQRCPKWLRYVLAGTAGTVVLVLLLAGAAWWYLHPSVERIDGVVYGERHGKPLTMDIIRPHNARGIGIAFMVSGGWRSAGPGETPQELMAPLLRRGYTVFAVCHISQPEATVMEIIEDVHRGVRFIRHHAEEYGIDPDHIGVTGGSAGGHLSLMLATCGGPGPADAADPVDRESSAVQAVAIFYPVTDLLNMGSSTENPGDGGPPRSFTEAFGPDGTDLEKWPDIGRRCSPIYFVTDRLPPVLICHGSADTLTPPDQSERFCDRARACGAQVELVIHEGGEHGWPTMFLELFRFADWFDRYLADAT